MPESVLTLQPSLTNLICSATSSRCAFVDSVFEISLLTPPLQNSVLRKWCIAEINALGPQLVTSLPHIGLELGGSPEDS